MDIKNFKIAYLLPNLFTAGSIFLAILAIFAAYNGNFERAFWYIVVSAVFDALDGRVARLTNTASQFGKEFDSLADSIAFGVAPAFILYFSVGKDYGKIGILLTALFIIFGAVRLARFNIISATTEPNVFIGLPIPAAALFVTSSTLLQIEFSCGAFSEIALLSASAVIAILMVSNIRYPSFKQIDFGKNRFRKVLLILIVVLSLFYLYPMKFLFAIALIYVLIGLVRAVWVTTYKKRKAHHAENNNQDI
ncbi:CDP-diacylglycerol--serine O-phosphatidyltransferase [Campylobacterota bacterium]|nr:CDP-diacylglycerol--serine O-phosphatidyltransferase [Campylobacterota bacterium]